jgi:Uma2 family endonuclease
MSLLTSTSQETLADRLERLGGVSPARIPMFPAPGTATEEHVLTTRPGGEKRIYELVDGMLVEKGMGYYESRLTLIIGRYLDEYLEKHDLGIALGADGTLRLAPGLVRIPDISFISWDHFPGRVLPAENIPDLAPDLAIEVLSDSNTPQEMARKRREYFEAGCAVVWMVDSRTRTARIYTAPESWTEVSEEGFLDGAPLLPGFRLSLRILFERAGRRQA